VGQRALLDMARVDARFEPVMRYLLSGWIASDGTFMATAFWKAGSETSTGPVFDALRKETCPGKSSLTAGLESAQDRGRAPKRDVARPPSGWKRFRRELESARVRANIASQAMCG
jgi:hypothetical protein